MVYGFVFEKLPFGGVNMDLLATPVPWPHPFSGSLKPTESLFFELLAASRSSRSVWESLESIRAARKCFLIDMSLILFDFSILKTSSVSEIIWIL